MVDYLMQVLCRLRAKEAKAVVATEDVGEAQDDAVGTIIYPPKQPGKYILHRFIVGLLFLMHYNIISLQQWI